VDHSSRALSLTKQRWGSQIDWESLAKMWGMLAYSHLLIGLHFTSWGDHFPLVPFYNNLNKPAPVRGADHWGPTRDSKYLLLSRYPEVVVVDSTSADDNIYAFSDIFLRHGIPMILHTDNGPAFNNNDSHLLQEYLRSLNIQHLPNQSTEDPEATGIMEAFIKHLKKIFHTAAVSYQDPYFMLNNYLMMVRATPHSSTGKSPV
jgi:hypothetical protein